MVVIIILVILFLIMGIAILIGKGDNLIAGYNTASKAEREEYDIKRLRGLVGGLLIVLGPMTLVLLEETLAAAISFIALTFILCIVVVILANTWAKKKSR